MNSFVHLDYSTRHPGVDRLENVAALAAQAHRRFDGTKGLASMLLTAMAAALVVAADQLVDTWADGHLLAAWVVLWAVGFASLGLLAAPARRITVRGAAALDAWSRQVARRRADARLWAIAQQDPRVMADLKAAMVRAQG